MSPTLISPSVKKALIGSFCAGDLAIEPPGARCAGCETMYRYDATGALDLRLQHTKRYPLAFELGAPLLAAGALDFESLQMNAEPEVDFSGMRVPWHLSREILSHIPKAKSPDSLMLDLGCGESIHKDVCEHAGFEWVGIDINPAMRPSSRMGTHYRSRTVRSIRSYRSLSSSTYSSPL